MKQEKALALLKSGKNIFLTGSAGTGKTYVLNSFIKYLNKYKIPTAVTASTGIAATHIKGQTIHSWVGMGIKDQMTFKEIHMVGTNKAFKKKIEKTKILIIDEISMLHQKQINLVDKILQYHRDSQLPFGGIQVVVCGDFFQLPPIGNGYELSKDKFAFMGESWVNAQFSICYLTEQFRQNKNSLSQVLNEIRLGSVSSESKENLNKASKNLLKNSSPIKLYTHNADVDKINDLELDKIDVKAKNFWAKTTGKKELIKTLKKSVIVNEKLTLKVGAKVMFVKNNTDKGYINGTLGKVIGFSEIGFPIVRTAGKKEIIASTEEWSIDNETGVSIASFIQIPLRLAWAITIHKSQGMTLDEVEMDLSKTFEKGQGYVALSRLREIEKLYLKGYNETALAVDKLAQKADVRFKELSDKLDDITDLKSLDTEIEKYKKACGGLTFIK